MLIIMFIRLMATFTIKSPKQMGYISDITSLALLQMQEWKS